MELKLKTMNKTFRVEFNQTRQTFHHAYASQNTEPNTHGWVTICEHMTDEEFTIFECYIKRTNKSKFTTEYLIKSLDELKKFINNLLSYNINISK